MRTLRHVAALGALGLLALIGFNMVAQAGTFVASNGGRPVDLDLTERFPDLRRSRYQLASLPVLGKALAEVSERYVDPERLDYPAMFKAGLEAVEAMCPEVVLRVDGSQLHVSVDRYSTMLQLRDISGPDELHAEAQRVAQILQTQLPKEEYDLRDVEYALVNGVLSTLDPHTMLLPPVAAKKMAEDNGGSFGGLGISIKMTNGELGIEYPMVGTPAFKAGLRPGDKIVKIDGEGTFNMDIEDAVSKMRGPPGTSVTLTIQREGDLARDVKLVRSEIKTAAVWGELLEGDVGFIEIPQFHQLVDQQLEAELAVLTRKAGPGGLKGLVLDMRDNPGGYLQQAIHVSDKFLADGVIVSTVARNGQGRDETAAKKTGLEPSFPMIVLMSGNSASAAEIVAGALKNQERAAILGERSFGKGSVQEIQNMDGEADLKLTVRRYLTPGDHSIQEIGIPADIETVRSIVAPPRALKEYGVQSGPRISMFLRDRVVREADLGGHFTNSENLETPAVYSLRYLGIDPADGETKSDRKDIRADFEVTLARDILVATTGSRRADVLRAAEKIVASTQKKQEGAIAAAFASQKIDWSGCANPATPDVALSFEVAALGSDAFGTTLTPGKLATVRATVQNRGSAPLCQLVGRATSEKGNDVLDGIEFYFGKLAPGESRSYETKAFVPGGYPAEVAPVSLALLDMSKKELAKAEFELTTSGTPLPRYAWQWTLNDAAGGDGDGIPEVGESITLDYVVENVGEGAGGEVMFNLRKNVDIGKAVELKNARFELKALAPGDKANGSLGFRIAAAPPEPKMSFEVSVRDNQRYDYGAVTRAGFYSYFVATDAVELEIGKAPAPLRREPPKVDVSRGAATAVSESSITLSGLASDERGVRDVIVYLGNRKLSYAGGGSKEAPVPTVPFSTSVPLEPGNNLIVVAVRDIDGFTTTRSIDVLRRPTVAKAAPATQPAAK